MESTLGSGGLKLPESNDLTDSNGSDLEAWMAVTHEERPVVWTPHWQPDRLPGKEPFDLAHRALGSKVEAERYEICEFYSSNQLNADPSNWWAPNLKALVGMCRAAGFSRIEIVHVQRAVARNRWWRALTPIKRPWGFRVVAHAYK